MPMIDGPHDARVEYVRIDDLIRSPRNARTHSPKQVRELARSIERFGFTNPILIDEENCILAGHGRVSAAAELAMAEVPCRRLSHMSEAEKRAYVIADNRLAEKAGWDKEILAIELQELIDLEFDVSLTGFEMPEVDLVLTEFAESSTKPIGPEDDHPEPPCADDAVTKLGDVWRLGRHLLHCADAKDPAAVARLMGDTFADMIFSDPPYNVVVNGHVSGLGRTRHREFVEASGEMSPEAFTAFLRETLTHAAAACRDGAIAFICIDWRHVVELMAAGREIFFELKNMCVWAKTNGGMGRFYRSQHELVLVWKVGQGPHTNTFGLGDKGRYRTNVWSYPGVNTFKAERMEELALHPTVKPVALVADAIRDVTHRGQVVLDVFGGSGTTLIAAEKTGRSARLLELDPAYCDVIVRRWERLTGRSAVLEGDDRTFGEIADIRANGVGAARGWGQ